MKQNMHNMSSSPPIHRHAQGQSDHHYGRSSWRNPPLDTKAHAMIALAVLIPSILTILLCLIIACIHRYKKRQPQQNSSMTPIDQHNAAIATILHNSQCNPFVTEESPPPYGLISKTEKDVQFITENNHSNEQFPLASIPNAAATAPPPPYYSNLIDSSTR